MSETNKPITAELTHQETALARATTAGHVALQGEDVGALPVSHLEMSQILPLEQSADADLTKDQKLELAAQWIDAQTERRDPDTQKELVPTAFASEVTILAQKQMNQLDEEGVVDDEFYDLAAIRDRAAEAADELDFELVQLSSSEAEWPVQVWLNTLHTKFKHVSPEAINSFLGTDDGQYERRALRIRNIVADHAPALLTEDIRTIVDPSQPLWRVSSAHASILLRNQGRSNIDDMHVDHIPTSLPVSSRMEYTPDDELAIKSVADMTDDELALYCHQEAVTDVREKGYARFDELTLAARETLLTRRLFEVTGKSRNQAERDTASERNRALEHEPVLQQGNLVHATSATEVLEAVLSNGLRCGEAIMRNSRGTIKYPFTVSFLEVTEQVAQPESMPERLKLLRNEGYGPINLVLHRDASSTETTKGQHIGASNQRQIFGGAPSTEVKSIIIKDTEATEEMVANVVQAVVKQGMFIPVYRGSTGEPLLTSQQFDQLSARAS